MENKNVPSIRFKGFIDDWEQRKLKDIVTFYNQDRIPIDSGNRTTGEYPYYGATGIIDYVEDYIFDGEYVLLAEDGANITMRNSPIAYITKGKFWLNNHAHIMKSNSENNLFLLQILEKLNYEKFNTGSAQPKLNSNVVRNIDLKISSSKEQTKIGNFFKQLDESIALQERELELLKLIKKGFLQQLFTDNQQKFPNIRFANFHDEWEQCKLGEIVIFFSGLTYSPENVKDKGTLVLRSSNIKNNNIVSADDVFVDDTVVNCEQVQIGDVIVVVRNGSKALIGKHAIIDTKMNNTVIGAFMTGIRSKSPYFINAILSTRQFNKEVEKNLGATINQITTSSFKRMEFIISKDPEEQTKIGDFFKEIDKTISLQEDKLKKLKETKKSFLQKMFI